MAGVRPALRAQQGQVLVLGMLLAAVLGLAWMRYFATGQVLAAKTRLVHGLDAAAYSGALVQARTLNFLAYLNRARMAHQLAMAHLVTLGSWAHYAGMESRRLAQGNPPAHLIGLMFGADHGRAYLAAAGAAGLEAQARAGGALGRAYAAHERFVHELSADLSRVLARDLPLARQDAMQAVLAGHYPERRPEDLRPVVSEDAWPGLLRHHAPDAPLFDWVRDLAGLYPFLDPRDHTARNPWPVSARCPQLRHELRRRGGTALDESGRWRAGDTQSFHAVRSNRWIGCYYREYAMGWAWMPAQPGQAMDASHVEDPPEDFADQDFWRWVRAATQWDLVGGRDNPLANSYALRDRQPWSSRGLGGYLDVAAAAGPDAASGFVVHMELADASGRPIRARSAAESLFSRPERRADGLDETPSLFHPYWHARLAAGLSDAPGD
ncbi:hypothetical protein [Castellaniella defragrans]|uniref:Uncharacterized protein n=2 Tax=Castellaniella defragrans TaxID=75697 RepID=W8X3S4_CASD6|nr:hypothetical protein [Castellaniella defragrans]KAB0608667.1 hypothetical protein F7Q88_13005 [Castellaniella defragrans]MBB6084277.1 hypothetical protein [Castellaniella defragrans]CDM24372.1 hypothetical protein BN940_09561 [Castellaniella defragrans 65Phen]